MKANPKPEPKIQTFKIGIGLEAVIGTLNGKLDSFDIAQETVLNEGSRIELDATEAKKLSSLLTKALKGK